MLEVRILIQLSRSTAHYILISNSPRHGKVELLQADVFVFLTHSLYSVLSLNQPWNQLLPHVPSSSSRRWYFRDKIWCQGMFTANCISLLLGPFSRKTCQIHNILCTLYFLKLYPIEEKQYIFHYSIWQTHT